jgi:dolichol-phosphate mannosyltransferase
MLDESRKAMFSHMGSVTLGEPIVSGSNMRAHVDLAVVIPTYNEKENIAELIARVSHALQEISWELIFVDDDSPDGTSDTVRGYTRRDPRIRLVHRIGRRGLSSACIEGILASTANYIAVMDADMQHDEAVLPVMLSTLRGGCLDLVVGTRNSQGGSMGQFCRQRVWLSRLGRKVSHAVCRCEVSDPMSGFFLCSRSFFHEIVRNLNGGGFKILVDMLASAERPVRLAEVGYTFRNRLHGESKLDVNTAVEYFYLIIDKLTGRIVPIRFVAFSLVGAAGVATHQACLAVLLFGFHLHFTTAQVIATYIAMTENFFLNNLITFHDRSLRGIGLLRGLATFCFACSFGAWANLILARDLLHSGAQWYVAGTAGIVLSSVWNYSMSNLFTWQKPQPVRMASETKTTACNQDISH